MNHIQNSSLMLPISELKTGPSIGTGQEVFVDDEWCNPHPAPLLTYDDCNNCEVVYKFGFGEGRHTPWVS